jgi:DNA-directed RNA polymerase subunit E'/Rpb7
MELPRKEVETNARIHVKEAFVHDTTHSDESSFDDGQDAWAWTWVASDKGTEDPVQCIFAQGETLRFRVCETKSQPEKVAQILLVMRFKGTCERIRTGQLAVGFIPNHAGSTVT